jgi:hypothetical protein
MPGMCGIEVLRSLPHGSTPCIIFLTAYDEYALAAFEVQALDYLLKPIDNVRFLIALERARRILALQQQDVLHSRFQKLLELHSERNDTGPAKRFAIRNGNQVAFVQSSEIDWIEAVGDYAGLHVGKKMHLLREPLHLLECRRRIPAHPSLHDCEAGPDHPNRAAGEPRLPADPAGWHTSAREPHLQQAAPRSAAQPGERANCPLVNRLCDGLRAQKSAQDGFCVAMMVGTKTIWMVPHQ